MTLTVESANRKDLNTGKSAELQHRHFSFIAAVIREIPVSQGRADVAERFAEACRGSNPRFDRRRFMAACGV